jgi:hypothetical protein
MNHSYSRLRMFRSIEYSYLAVMPAQAGMTQHTGPMDPCLRRDDSELEIR